MGDPEADRLIKERGGIVGIWQSRPACVVFRLGDGSLLTLWDGGTEYPRSWEVAANALPSTAAKAVGQ